jgi:hypothetical protein
LNPDLIYNPLKNKERATSLERTNLRNKPLASFGFFAITAAHLEQWTRSSEFLQKRTFHERRLKRKERLPAGAPNSEQVF